MRKTVTALPLESLRKPVQRVSQRESYTFQIYIHQEKQVFCISWLQIVAHLIPHAMCSLGRNILCAVHEPRILKHRCIRKNTCPYNTLSFWFVYVWQHSLIPPIFSKRGQGVGMCLRRKELKRKTSNHRIISNFLFMQFLHDFFISKLFWMNICQKILLLEHTTSDLLATKVSKL